MSSSYTIQNGLHGTATFTNLIAPVNTKGTLMINDGIDVGFLPVGTDGQFATANSASTLGVEWQDKPGGVATNSITYLIAGIESENATTNYSAYAYPSAINAWGSDFCEGVSIAYSTTDVVRTTIRPGSNATWGNITGGNSFTITLGKLTGGGQIGTTGTFTPYVGTGATIVVNSTHANTRNVIITTANIDVVAGDSIAVRCVNNVGFLLEISVFIFIRGALTS